MRLPCSESALLKIAKTEAAQAGKTLSDLVNDSLRSLLAKDNRQSPTTLTLTTFGPSESSGTPPGIDFSNNKQVRALLGDCLYL